MNVSAENPNQAEGTIQVKTTRKKKPVFIFDYLII